MPPLPAELPAWLVPSLTRMTGARQPAGMANASQLPAALPAMPKLPADLHGASSLGSPLVPYHLTFQDWYRTHDQGPGIWKWSNSLDAYERHLGPLAGSDLKIAEVGIQSGGSMAMWHDVLGKGCQVYGIDINPACKKFEDKNTKIFLGDEGKLKTWADFFTEVTPNVDVLVDDGGHEPSQMLTTMVSVWPHVNPGGFLVIEDIHGPRYLDGFFRPAANFLAKSKEIDSLHVYPYMFFIQKAGESKHPKSKLTFVGEYVKVADFDAMWTAVGRMHMGGAVVLENAGWGSFFTAQGIINFLALFHNLHDAQWQDTPAGCSKTGAKVCTNSAVPTPMQAKITGVHIFDSKCIVEVAARPVVLEATRKGSDWLEYR